MTSCGRESLFRPALKEEEQRQKPSRMEHGWVSTAEGLLSGVATAAAVVGPAMLVLVGSWGRPEFQSRHQACCLALTSCWGEAARH